MPTGSKLGHRIREVFLDGKWIANTNYQQALSSVDLVKATKKIGNCNSIALLTYHVNYYLMGLIEVYKGGNLGISDKYSFDMPLLPTEKDWNKLRAELLENAETFASLVTAMDESELNSDFVSPEYGNNEKNIVALIEHSYYHLGQIVLLQKLIDLHTNGEE